MDQVLPFQYLELADVLAASPIRSKSGLYSAIRLGKAPAPDLIGGRSLWRSDRISEWLLEVAARADAGRKELAQQREAKARAARAGRKDQRAAA